MPVKELIPSIEDREFPSGSGNWTGDQVWSSDPIGGHDSYITLTSSPLPQEVNSYLYYPYIKPKRNMYNGLRFQAARKVWGGGASYFRWYFGDGVYAWEGGPFYLMGINIWLYFSRFAIIPLDWNIKNTYLRIQASGLEGNWGTYAFDNFSLRVLLPPQSDHLPLMGVH